MTPSSSAVAAEHASLLKTVDSLAAGDSAITELAELLSHHFSEEERIVFPLLAALPTLASGGSPDNTDDLIRLAGLLETEAGHMSAEHQMAGVLITQIKRTAETPRMNLFFEALGRHTRFEEEILFPAAIVAGRYAEQKKRLSERERRK